MGKSYGLYEKINSLKVAKNGGGILKNRLLHHGGFLLFTAFFLHPFSIPLLNITYKNRLLSTPHISHNYSANGRDTYTHGDRMVFIFLAFITLEVIPYILLKRSEKMSKDFNWNTMSAKSKNEEPGIIDWLSQSEPLFQVEKNTPGKVNFNKVPMTYGINLRVKGNGSEVLNQLKGLLQVNGVVVDGLDSEAKDKPAELNGLVYSVELACDPSGQVNSYGTRIRILIAPSHEPGYSKLKMLIYKSSVAGTYGVINNNLPSLETQATRFWTQLVATGLGIDNALIDKITTEPAIQFIPNGESLKSQVSKKFLIGLGLSLVGFFLFIFLMFLFTTN